MTRKSIFTAGTALVLTTLLAVGTTTQVLVGQDGVQQPAAQQRATTARHDAKAARASIVTGMTVRNVQGKDLGTINDLMVDLKEGKVVYAALTRGGLAGVGSSYYAIDWKLFEFKQHEDGDYLLLRIDDNAFENAEGFDTDNWPAQADQRWTTSAKQSDQSRPRVQE
ncbi:MAG: PRC-barrel domain-containing protein [Pirellulaceae bacterium]